MKSGSAYALAGSLFLAAAFTLGGLSQTSQRAAHTPSKSRIAHGEYIVKGVAGCADCHTPMNNKGEPVPGQWLKGSKLSFGPLVPFPQWANASPNIAGLQGWKASDAVHLLMTGLTPSGHPLRPPMPQYHMNRSDAEAVVAYLKSLK